MVETFLNNPEPPVWIPPKSATASNQEFLKNLQIPSYRNGNPSLLFHNLDVCDNEEIEMIFGHGAHQFICNTSGSGKTRRMLEGLTKYWGFYLVATPDSNGVGVRDLRNALDDLHEYYSAWTSDLEKVDVAERAAQEDINSQIISKHLRKVLAARVVVFELFLQLAIQADGILQEKHKRIWLLFQLSDFPVPSAPVSHPFVRIIKRCLVHASSTALDALVDRLGGIRRKYLQSSHFILGLDEAQWASRKFPRSFISSTNPARFRSIIREVVKVFTKWPIKLILSGTGVSLKDLEDSTASGVSKPQAVEMFHKLGMFDTLPKLKSFVERYVPAYIWESRSGHRLQQRMREYLLGRYRFSVSFVEYLLINGLESPHTLLNQYIEALADCLPGDIGEPFLEGEPDPRVTVQLGGFDWERLELDSIAVGEAVRIVQSHLLQGGSPIFGPVPAELVEYGIARLVEEHKGQIVEPLAFLSLMRWLETTNQFNVDANLRLRLGDQGSRGNAFEEVGIPYLLRALCRPEPLTTVFDLQFPSSWANEKYQIVARLDKDDVPVGVLPHDRYVPVDVLRTYSQNPGLCVVDYASSIKEIIDWIDGMGTASAVLIPSQSFGPDVMVRCRSSPINVPSSRTLILMGRFKSYTVGNKGSFDVKTVTNAVSSLHADHWFKQSPYDERRKLIDTIENHDVLRFVEGYPLVSDLRLKIKSDRQAIQALGAVASIRVDIFRSNFKSEDEWKSVERPLSDG